MHRTVTRIFLLAPGLALFLFVWILATVDTGYLFSVAMRAVSGLGENSGTWQVMERLRLVLAAIAENWHRIGIWLADSPEGWSRFSFYSGAWVQDRFLALELLLHIVIVRFGQWKAVIFLSGFFAIGCLVDGAASRMRALTSFRAPLPALSACCGLSALLCILFSPLLFLLPFAWTAAAAALLVCAGGAAAGIWLAHFHRFG